MPSIIKNKLLYWEYKYFNGLLSVLTNRIPDYKKVSRVLFVVSCTWEKADSINIWMQDNFPNAKIKYLLRDSFPGSFKEKDILLSSKAINVLSKINVVSDLRKMNFDVVVTCWSNEKGYTALKLLPLFVNARVILAFNENADCLWLVRRNFSQIFHHIFNRFPKEVRLQKACNILTIIFLLPLGLIYVIFRFLYYTMKKYFLSFFTASQKN